MDAPDTPAPYQSKSQPYKTNDTSLFSSISLAKVRFFIFAVIDPIRAKHKADWLHDEEIKFDL